ncbi:MAG: phosphate acyltransferase PlsX [Gammaproteobacteria bacterium]|nr:phosphate acyltransferase PlsX [Gammaproteobacteria bacterium]
MTAQISIAVDAMSGDHGPSVTVPAAAFALSEFPSLKLTLVGDRDEVGKLWQKYAAKYPGRVEIVHASQVVEMHERPSSALRGKRDSSMRVSLDLVKEGIVRACVSAGNTGALMATARYVLKTLPGIDRPAICTSLPGIAAHTHVLDLGANVDSGSEELFRFAVMGSVLASAIENKPSPTVALLNVGEEEIKGNDRVKQTAALLEASDLNYVGYVEGDDIYRGKVDVIVCDGFVGNVALKASEGVARLIHHTARDEFTRSLFTKLAAVAAIPVLNRLGKRLDPRRYNGASMLGLRGIVVKSHGSADALSFSHAIKEAVIEVDKRVPERISSVLEQMLLQRNDV